MKKPRPNYLLEAVIKIMRDKPRGKVLDLGCGKGEYAKKLKDLGFEVVAADIDIERFKYHLQVDFKVCNLNEALPFSENYFDYVLFLEVIEHIYNPFFVISEISRILKADGLLILSTPNILNIRSRLRFLFEGNFDFFREPILDYNKIFPAAIQNMHIMPWRFQELEYLLFKNNLYTKKIHTDLIKPELKLLSFILKPLVILQCRYKEKRSLLKGGVDYSRINKILLSKELFLGRHLIIEARKS